MVVADAYFQEKKKRSGHRTPVGFLPLGKRGAGASPATHYTAEWSGVFPIEENLPRGRGIRYSFPIEENGFRAESSFSSLGL